MEKLNQKPRNWRLHAILISKKGGAHGKTEKAIRRKEKMNVSKMIKEQVIQSENILNNLFNMYMDKIYSTLTV